MPGLFFWNLYGRQQTNQAARAANICQTLTRLCRNRELDVLVFSECDAIPDGDITAALNAANNGVYVLPPSRSRRIRIWTRLSATAIEDRYNGRVSDRITIREVTFPNCQPILLVGCHLVDRQTVPSDIGRMQEAVAEAERIRKTERDGGHQRTVLIGDLNMNPYEAGVVATQALHAVMTKELARTVSALSARRRRTCFYNPMWSCFGDIPDGPAGTHYWTRADEPTNHFWHTYDQVLLRPELIDQFVRVEILIHDGHESLVTPSGRPRGRILSDHLPLYCEFNFT